MEVRQWGEMEYEGRCPQAALASQKTQPIAWLDSTSWDKRCETMVSQNSLAIGRKGSSSPSVFFPFALTCYSVRANTLACPFCLSQLCFLALVTAVGEARVSMCPDPSVCSEGGLSLPVTAVHGDSPVCAGGSGRGHHFTIKTTVWVVVRAALARKQGKCARTTGGDGPRRCALVH